MPKLKEEQAQAVFHDKGNILISASAGSGKTFVMIERLIRLIVEGKAGVKEILAVTFTEMAAREMKEKLKTALTKKIYERGGDKRLVRELQELPTANISTMHAFCAYLARTYFYATGIAPDFKILDETESSALKLECINKVFRRLYESKEEWFYNLLSRHLDNRSDGEFKNLIIKMSDRGRENADPLIYYKQAQSVYTESGFNNVLAEYKKSLDVKLSRLLERLCDAQKTFTDLDPEIYNEKVIKFIDSLAEDIETVLNSTDVYIVKRFEEYKLELPRGVKFKDYLNKVYQSVKDIREEFKEIVKQAGNGLTDRDSDYKLIADQREHVLSLFKIVNSYEELYAQAKKEENALDFSDLEHSALTILNDEEIRKEVQNKYKYIFIDEYQDTNGAQEEIISRISSDNLFMVGDAKQSIYGFRGCRPEIFLSKLENMTKNGEKTVLLNHNFRSSHKIIELVNKVFSFSMNRDYFGMSYSETSMLKSGGVYGEDKEGRVELHLIKTPAKQSREYEKPRVYDILEELDKPRSEKLLPTPTLIANVIEKELGKDFYDPKLEQMRPVTYGDICILTRNRDSKYVRDIVKTLVGYSIPVVSVVKENVCDHPEIRQLVDALKLIDCFNQDVPLAGALKSPIGNFTDEDLAKIVIRFNDDKLKGSFYNAFTHYIEQVDDELAKRLKEFKDYFTKIRTIADFTGAYGALKRITLDKNIEQTFFSQQFGRLKVKRLNRLLSASMVDGRPLSVKELLDKIERFPQSFGLSDGAEENSVKVMTMHASKGLEFPVVIVCGLEKYTSTKGEREEVMFDQDLGFAVKSYDDAEKRFRETPLRMVLRSRMRDARLKEELRLFYVALTRASYSLHLMFSGTKDTRSEVFSGAKRFLDYLPNSIELTEHEIEELEPMANVVGVKKVLIGKADNEKKEKINDNLKYFYPFMEDTTLPLKNSVTKATHALTEDTPLTHVLFDGDGPDKEKGNVAHKILELLDFSKKQEFYAQVQDMISDGKLVKEQVGKIDLSRLEKAINSPVLQGIEEKKLYREKDFIVSLPANVVFDVNTQEEVVVQGIIDLLAVGENGAIIVDYKYSSLDALSLKARYKKQLDLYALALERATKIPTLKKVLLNLFTGDTIEV